MGVSTAPLSANWMTERMDHVVDTAVNMLTRILFEGIMREGLLPFEKPITDDLIDRATIEQVDVLMETSSPEEQEDLLRKI